MSEIKPDSSARSEPPQDRQLAWDAWKLEHENGRRAHSEHATDSVEHFKATIAFAVEAIRTTALINGGALVASLALVGATSQNRPELAAKLIDAVPAFAVGVLCAGVASSTAYFAQYAFHVAHGAMIRKWEHPYIEVQSSSQRWQRFGIFCQLVAIGVVICSYGSVLYGASVIYGAWPH